MNIQYKLWLAGNDKVFGHGPYQLLQYVSAYGSLSEAAKQMSMSYSKAHHVITRAERQLGFKLIERTVGGANGGGSQLTLRAKHWLERYRQLNAAVEQTIALSWHQWLSDNFQHDLIVPLHRRISSQSSYMISVIGGGGKTSLMNALWASFNDAVSTLFTSTTHMMLPSDIDCYYRRAPASKSLALFDCLTDVDKVKGIDTSQLNALYDERAYRLILCEADGSRNLPFKVYQEGEPPLSQRSDHVFIVVGCDVFTRPIKEVVHRFQRLDLPSDAILTVKQAIDYMVDHSLTYVAKKSVITIVFNKYATYGLPVDIAQVAEWLRPAARPIQLMTVELERRQLYHYVEVGFD